MSTTGVYPARPKGLPHTFACSTGPARDIDSLLPPARLGHMEVNFRPETESRLQELANRSGRAPNDLIEDALAAYLQEVVQLRDTLDRRYDDLKAGRVKPIDGEKAFTDLRRKSQQRHNRT
jgi:predicted transcriptional regulator